METEVPGEDVAEGPRTNRLAAPLLFIPLSARSCRAEVGEGAALPAALGAWSVPAAPRATGSVR